MYKHGCRYEFSHVLEAIRYYRGQRLDGNKTRESEKPDVLIILSDREDPSGDLKMKEDAQKAGVVVSFGTNTLLGDLWLATLTPLHLGNAVSSLDSIIFAWRVLHGRRGYYPPKRESEYRDILQPVREVHT